MKYVYLLEMTEFARDTFVLKTYAKVFTTFDSALAYARNEMIATSLTIEDATHAQLISYYDNTDWTHKIIDINKVKIEN